MALDDCVVCQRTVDGDSPAVGLSGDPESATWIPFVEDLRTSGFRLVHPACFAAERGVDALIEVVHEEDRRTRTGNWKMIDKIEQLRKALGTPGT